jgi:hypothetical protein
VDAKAFYVKWDEFIEELSSALNVNISKDDQALMKHVLGKPVSPPPAVS